MFKITTSGSFNKTNRFLRTLMSGSIYQALDRGGQRGVDALSAATPIRTSQTANLWRYEIERKGSFYKIHWLNDHVEEGVNIAVLIQYGHGTGTGGLVLGREYINTALLPVFDDIAADVWKGVNRA